MENIKRIDFCTVCCSSGGKPIDETESSVTILFNTTTISATEVRELIQSGSYEYDNRIVVTTPARADNLKNKTK